MSDDLVVVAIKLNSGEDLIAIFVKDLGHAICIEHPYYISYTPMLGGYSMLPYCPYSDEVYYQISRDKINFMVTATNEITMRFLDMVDDVEQKAIINAMRSEEPYDRLEAAMKSKLYIQGNDTKH